jgi:hypothetical protein
VGEKVKSERKRGKREGERRKSERNNAEFIRGVETNSRTFFLSDVKSSAV